MQPVMVNSRTPVPVQSERMRGIETRVAALERQISTGARRATPSDDPSGAARGARLARLDRQLEADRQTLEAASARLAQAQVAIGASHEHLLRARDLALAAANGTLGPDDRALVQREVAELVQSLRTLSNRTDEAGLPLFSGALGDRPAFAADAEDRWRWQGFSQGPGAAATSPGAGEVPTGRDLFGDDGDGAFATLAAFLDALDLSDPSEREAAMAQLLDALERDTRRLLVQQATVGAREARVATELGELSDRRLELARAVAAVDGVDLTAAIAELQALQLTLAATQAVFSRLYQSTLFDRLA